MYRELAPVYDRLSSIDYKAWTDTLVQVFDRAGLEKGCRILDLACGTGNISLELAKRGYQVVGIDYSAEMLAVAEEKLRRYRVPLYQADMRKLPPLSGKFSAVVCLTDSLNYLSNIDEVHCVLHKLYKLTPGLLVFDINTPHYLENVLGNNQFDHVDDDLAFIWHNHFDALTNKCEMQITFFNQTSTNLYTRFDEVHVETAFGRAEIEQALAQTGWHLTAAYDGYSDRPAGEDSERWLFVAR
ncbi:MAG TPA: class I SAM-dependent methyltransferase [Desulfobacteria bacterium]|nr:class I SAM-dependent methyltransferase [Desulfobacteria bacterium]